MKHIYLMFYFSIFCTFPLLAQEIHTYTGWNNLPPSLQFLKVRHYQRENFKKLTDSLFMAGEYDKLISISKDSLDNQNLKQLAQCNLVGVYYKRGQSDSSKVIISEMESNYGDDYFEISVLFSPHCISAISYMDEEKHRVQVEEYIISNYRKENYSKIEDGVTLIKLINYDQWIRRGNFFSKKKLAFINWPDRKFRKADDKQKNKVYEFLKNNNGLFTKAEVGDNMFTSQFLLMAHDDNKKHRKLYFSYVKKAADEGICLRTRILDFLLRTDVLNMGWPKFKKIEKERIEQLKKEYNITEDYSFGAF